MMKNFKYLVFAFLMLVTEIASAEQLSVLEETFFASGKIYVVVTVCMVILIGIFTYLFRTERKLKELEKEVYANNKES
ncbi:MAG: CcmD family protein [Flavobacteriales bacterium]|jgi:CcmD family protein